MRKPDNIDDALRHLQTLLLAIDKDIGNYLEDPAIYGTEFFEDIKDAALDAHLLVTWVKDNIKGETK
jgi:hypothetical protein